MEEADGIAFLSSGKPPRRALVPGIHSENPDPGHSALAFNCCVLSSGGSLLGNFLEGLSRPRVQV